MSRASIYWKGAKKRGGYRKQEDGRILEAVKAVLEKRPTYGYKRVTAIVNQNRLKRGFKRLNRKRIYRVMKNANLLFKKRKRERERKTGRIVAKEPDRRWCSDIFEIRCFNGEKVYVAFGLDCHDRECLGYVAKPEPLKAMDIQGLMLLCVERRFASYEAPWQVEWLSDRGAVYRALETVSMGRRLGLKSCFTAPYSPESNGMSEAFVKTIKRDYVYVSDCYSARSVMRLLKGWIRDYNAEAPHSGLGMKSPLEYRRWRARLEKRRRSGSS